MLKKLKMLANTLSIRVLF